jgi:hypothetical protein
VNSDEFEIAIRRRSAPKVIGAARNAGMLENPLVDTQTWSRMARAALRSRCVLL